MVTPRQESLLFVQDQSAGELLTLETSGPSAPTVLVLDLRQDATAESPSIFLVPWITLAGLASLPFLRQKLVFLSLALIPLGYMVCTNFGEFLLPRHKVANIPFVFCLAAGPFEVVARLLLDRHHHAAMRNPVSLGRANAKLSGLL